MMLVVKKWIHNSNRIYVMLVVMGIMLYLVPRIASWV
jgi:hypothetical protein